MATITNFFLADMEERSQADMDELSQANIEELSQADVLDEQLIERNIAPNLSALVGTAVAAKLITSAGGLSSLAKMPACNILNLGVNLAGYIEQTDIIQTTPPPLRKQVCILLATKSLYAARVDSLRGDRTGIFGKYLREEIRIKIEKWQDQV
ncbi:hypothetical protein A4A49_19681 [Nicotiana attenuata]|uniref:Nop domain-containing protein n=1 Tax=Nicotiana attenuata TaxID=49451 RepID=A0A1J6KDS0_NICAT|nr:hypothetical protein A4A49_19681 [Nicotiana attenuata]